MNDALRTVFSENLRHQVGRYPSIAHICRGVPINRQQFNKYLLGYNFPSPKIRRKLCEFFGIPEEELFADRRKGQARAEAQRPSGASFLNGPTEEFFAKELTRGLRQCSDFNTSPVLRPGFYFCYFHLQNFSGYAVRSLVKITHKSGGTSFARHTYFRSNLYPPKIISRGRHRGIIFHTPQEITFLGFSSSSPHHFSLLTFTRQKETDDDVLLGVGITKGSESSFASRVYLEFIGSQLSEVRHKLNMVGVVNCNAHTIHPTISAAMAKELETLTSQLDIIDFEQIAIRLNAAPQESRSRMLQGEIPEI